MSRFDPRALALAVALALTAASCSIPTGEPQALSAEGHEDLLAGTTTTSTPQPFDDTVDIMLFFIGPGDKLESVSRLYEENPLINDVLQGLESPPLEEEQAQFAADLVERGQETGLLTTEVLPNLGATLQGTAEDNALGFRTVKVDPAAGMREQVENNPAQARLGASQLVCTFLNLPGLEGVTGLELVDDKGSIPLTDSASQPIDGPATKANFNDCKTGMEQLDEQAEATSSTTSAEPTTEPKN